MTPAIFGLSGLTLSADETAFFREADPAGYILFGRNVESRDQLLRLTDSLRALHGRERLFISVDQEGGRVARLKPPVWDSYPAGDVFARLWDIAPASAIEAARCNARLLAFDLAEAGITVDYAPVMDVRQDGAHDVIGDRALGAHPVQVAALGRAVLDGLAQGGVAGCVKHMPGHGRAMADSHRELPVVDASLEELEWDMRPFKALSSAAIGMTAHVRYTALDPALPATLSHAVIAQHIRGTIGFNGLLLTDDLDMEALDGNVPQRAAKAIAAGCDLALNCWAKMPDMVGIAAHLPPLSEAGHERLEKALNPQVWGKAEGDGLLPDNRAEVLEKRNALLALLPA